MSTKKKPSPESIVRQIKRKTRRKFSSDEKIRKDRSHEFQAQFHWHVEDLGIKHVYIKPRPLRLNGKVERSHRADEQEFYQLLHYTDDVDLNKKLKIWEDFYNFHRPHGSFKGKTPYEVLKERISAGQNLLSVV